MIVVTGAAGFIGSNLIRWFNVKGNSELIAVDEIGDAGSWQNLAGLSFSDYLSTSDFARAVESDSLQVDAVFHLGACSDTTTEDFDYLYRQNIAPSRMIWKFATRRNIPLVYASSAATYGSKETDLNDSHSDIHSLEPLNRYGLSKHIFDQWALAQTSSPPRWYGLKFFNVYGPGENYKGRMSSMVHQGFKQARETGKIKLFAASRPEMADGGHSRDFVFVDDVLATMEFLADAESFESGIYNVGTGQSRSFNDLARSVFSALEMPENIEYFPMPSDLERQYQHGTKADISKLRAGGFDREFASLESGVAATVKQLLISAQALDQPDS